MGRFLRLLYIEHLSKYNVWKFVGRFMLYDSMFDILLNYMFLKIYVVVFRYIVFFCMSCLRWTL